MMSAVDWESQRSYVFPNPSSPLGSELKELENLLESHIWISTSGTTQKRKWVGLSKKAMLSSASAVNRHLKASAADSWLNPLPLFHVGGLGILARAYLTRTAVQGLNGWDVIKFLQSLEVHKNSLTSLVPTQVFDLVSGHCRCPASLRAVVVGGGALTSELYLSARALGWPLLPSYGLSECASQVATASLESLESCRPKLKILDHVQSEVEEGGRFKIKSPALFTAYADWNGSRWELTDPKIDDWFATEDRVRLQDEELVPLGRITDDVKVLGELVNLSALNFVVEKIKNESGFTGDVHLLAHKDDRMGSQIDLVTAGMDFKSAEVIKGLFNARVLPFERSTNVYVLRELPKSELGKIQRATLLELLGL